MNRTTKHHAPRLALLVLSLTVFAAAEARAGVIVGPTTFSNVGGVDTLWGIQFTALQDATLTSFDYNHNPTTFGNPFSGTVSVIDTTSSMTVYSANYSPRRRRSSPSPG